MPKQYDDLENLVFDAAKRLLIRFGFAKTSMDEIAREAGIAKSTLYTRWHSKEALLTDLIWRESKFTTQAWFERVQADPEGGALKAIYGHALEVLFSNEFWMAVLKQDKAMLGTFFHKLGISEFFSRRWALNTLLIKRLQEVGVVRDDLDASMIAYQSLIMQYGLLRMDEVIPMETAPPYLDNLALNLRIMQDWLTPQGEVNHEAGKQVIREFMAQAIAQMDIMEAQMQAKRRGQT